MHPAIIKLAILSVAMASIGFAAGALVFSKSANHSSPKRQPTEPSIQEWSANQPRATGTAPGETPARDDFKRAHQAKRNGIGTALRTHLKLVADTPVADLPGLLLRFERLLPDSHAGSSTGEIVREAIFDRLLVEAPDSFLEFALTGRSNYVSNNFDSAMTALLEQPGYDYETLEAKISAAGEIPAVTTKMMHALLSTKIRQDPESGWKLAVQNRMADLPRLAETNMSSAIVDAVILGDNPQRLPKISTTGAFQALASEDVAIALDRFNRLEGSAIEKESALAGIANAIGTKRSAQVDQFVDSLSSDEERLAFFRNALTDRSAARFQGSFSPKVEAIQDISNERIRRVLLEEHILTWKTNNPRNTRAWAESNDMLELFERLQVTSFPVTPVSPTLFDFRNLGSGEYDPPEIPSQFKQSGFEDE